MKTVAIIQCRMGSTRFPGKVLKPILNIREGDAAAICSPEFIYNACKLSGVVDEVVIACPTSDYETFSEYAKELKELTGKHLYVFGGSEENVYQRTLRAAQYRSADIIVDITGDCPFVSSWEIRSMMGTVFDKLYKKQRTFFYYSNVFPERCVPDGMDIQIYSTAFMENNSEDVAQPGHSGWNLYMILEGIWGLYLYENSFLKYYTEITPIRITLDTPEDLEVLRKLAPVFMHLPMDTKEGTEKWYKYLIGLPDHFWDNSGIVAKEIGDG